jgi:hypothetical protein
MHEPAASEGKDRTLPHGARECAIPSSEETQKRFDPELRHVLELIETEDWPLLKVRTGIEHGRDAAQSLALFVELATGQVSTQRLKRAFGKLGLNVGAFWYREIERRHASGGEVTILPARLPLKPGDAGRTDAGVKVVEQLSLIAASPFVRRLRLATAHPRCLRKSLRALDWPTPDGAPDRTLTGRNIVIGIIDEGCAFAHHEFLVLRGRRYRTRVLRLWDQSSAPSTDDRTKGWSDTGLPYGREIANTALDRVIARHVVRHRVDDAAVYAELNYPLAPPDETVTHGTMVMSIAAGDGTALMGDRGVAPDADLIFVHLPPVEVDTNDASLGDRIADGAEYIFDQAAALGREAAVVNISYGGYRGAHDGTNPAELALDELLWTPNRAVVVSAGNGFDADCHADEIVPSGTPLDIAWQIPAADPTPNDVELWYDGAASLEVTLVAPDGEVHGPFGFGARQIVRDGKTIGEIDHTKKDARNGDNVALIALRPTDPLFPSTSTTAPAPAGMWTLKLTHSGSAGVPVHAWIARDDLGGPGARRQQSRFVRARAKPRCTIGDLASGRRTIAVGAFNVHTGEICRYSACGPTRLSGGLERKKPEVYAPAEEEAAGRGVLAAASGRAQPRRLNGTSAAAPHIAGLIALIFEFARHPSRKIDLDAAAIGNALEEQLGPKLLPNLYITADPTRPIKQQDVMGDLVALLGKASLKRTLQNI